MNTPIGRVTLHELTLDELTSLIPDEKERDVFYRSVHSISREAPVDPPEEGEITDWWELPE